MGYLAIGLDPERTVYATYGLERSFRRSWNLKTMWRYVRLLTSGRQWRGIQGDSAQLGGDFVVDAGGIVRLAYRSYDPTDRPPVANLLALLRQLDISKPLLNLRESEQSQRRNL